MHRFWNWSNNQQTGERELRFEGVIAEGSWFEDNITPTIFRDELFRGQGDVTIWINSPGGDCFAAAKIYNMLKEYQGQVTIKIDAIAASAASVIAMAGDMIQMAPVSMLMIHNPSVGIWGESDDMKKAIQMLEEVKESIINAYESKTNLSRELISDMMDQETWMNAYSALDFGFIDSVIYKDEEEQSEDIPQARTSSTYRKLEVTNNLMDKMAKQCEIIPQQRKSEGRSVENLLERLDVIKKFI